MAKSFRFPGETEVWAPRPLVLLCHSEQVPAGLTLVPSLE